jgi:hypothetical protein
VPSFLTRSGRTAGAILLAVFVSTLATAGILVVFSLLGWLAGYGVMAILVVVAFVIWLSGIVYLSKLYLKDTHAKERTGSTASSTSSNEVRHET